MPIKQTQGFNIHTGISDFGSSISVAEIDDLEVISPGPTGIISFSNASLANIKNIACIEVDADAIVAKSVKADQATITDVAAVTLNAATAAITNLRAGLANITEATITTLHSVAIDSTRVVATNLNAAVASLGQLTSTTGDIATLSAGSLAVRGNSTIKGNEICEGNLQVNGKVQILGLATITEATIATLHTTITDCVRLLTVNLSAAIAGFAQMTCTAGDVETLAAGSLTVRGDATIVGSLKAGNIISTVLTIVSDATGFYVWTHAPLKPPVFHIAIPEAGEVLRMMNTTATSARFFFYTAAPLRVHFLAIGL
jgi:hypothetical protein